MLNALLVGLLPGVPIESEVIGRGTGFFYVKNHGIPKKMIDDAFAMDAKCASDVHASCTLSSV